MPSLSLYILFWPSRGLLTYIGGFKTWPHKKDVHNFWSLHPPLRYAPSVGLKHDTNGNFLNLGLTWIPRMGGWLLYYTNTANFYPFSQYFHDLFDLSWPLNDLLALMNQNMCILKKCRQKFYTFGYFIYGSWICITWNMIENVTKHPLFQDYITACFQPRDLFDLCLPQMTLHKWPIRMWLVLIPAKLKVIHGDASFVENKPI